MDIAPDGAATMSGVKVLCTNGFSMELLICSNRSHVPWQAELTFDGETGTYTRHNGRSADRPGAIRHEGVKHRQPGRSARSATTTPSTSHFDFVPARKAGGHRAGRPRRRGESCATH